MSQSRIEAYLDEMERHLLQLSPSERQEWRREAVQHLVALADAEEELGLERTAAEEAAIHRFGAPQQIGGMLDAEHRRVRGAGKARHLSAAAAGLACGLGGTILALPLLARAIFYEQRLGIMPSVGSALPAFAIMWLGLLIGGAVIGRRLGARAYLSHGALPYLALMLPTLWLSTPFSTRQPHLLELLAAVGGGLLLGALAARFADPSCEGPRPVIPAPSVRAGE